MDPREFEAQIGEIEGRLDRLKALYEQYFQGFERLEPTIPRKDVERRIQELRREQPRNTALRFRFQMLLQRYTTFQVYWNRIARQIEEGTYRRDLLRARRRRHELQEQRRSRPPTSMSSRPPTSTSGWDVDIDLENADSSNGEGRSSSLPPSAPPPRDPSTISVVTSPPNAPLRNAQPPAARASFPAPITATFGRPKDAPIATARASTLSPEMEPGKDTRRGDSVVAPLPQAPGRPPPPPRAPAVLPSAESAAARGPAAPVKGSPPPPPGRAPSPQPPPAARAPSPQPPAAPARAPSPQPPPAERSPAPLPPVAAVAPNGALREERVRRIYEEYVDAKKRNNERTDNVRFENVAQSIRDMIPKLQEKHKGSAIDFEIVVRDGRVGLKPTPKK